MHKIYLCRFFIKCSQNYKLMYKAAPKLSLQKNVLSVHKGPCSQCNYKSKQQVHLQKHMWQFMKVLNSLAMNVITKQSVGVISKFIHNSSVLIAWNYLPWKIICWYIILHIENICVFIVLVVQNCPLGMDICRDMRLFYSKSFQSIALNKVYIVKVLSSFFK